MQIVIEIDESKYNAIMNYPKEWDEWALNAIKHGTPLPEGCGRMGDLSELETRIGNFIEYHKNLLEETNPEALVYMNHILDGIRYTDTIIEADKESEE